MKGRLTMTSQNTAVKKPLHGIFCGAQPLSKKQNKILDIFFYTVLGGTLVAMLAIILYYVYAFAAKTYGSDAFDWLLGIFSDFVYIMDVSLGDSPYTVSDSSYPPLAIAVLYPFALICKGVFAQYDTQALTVDELTSRVILHSEFWVAMVLFFVLCSAAVWLLFVRVYKLQPLASVKLAVILLMCAPFVYAVMRGNTVYFAMIFLLIFLLLYDSESAALRELGYLSLVIAGLIKIYPLFFGVFLLAKKKFFASVRIAVYTAVLFLLSFFLFEGGTVHIRPFIANLGGFAGNEYRLLMGNNLSLSHLLYCVLYPFSVSDEVFGAINIIMLLLVFLFATVCAIVTRSTLARLIIAAAVVVLIPSVSYFYVLIFMTLPFMQFVREYDTLPCFKQRLYTLLFLVIFFTPLILPINFILQSLSVIIMLVTECTGALKSKICKKSD